MPNPPTHPHLSVSRAVVCRTVMGMHLLTRTAEALGLAVRTVPATDTTTGHEASVLPPARAAATAVAPREALTLDAVFRAFMVLQTAVEQLTLDEWDRGALVPDEARTRLVVKPDPDKSLADHLAETTTSLAARGNAYWRVHRWTDGTPVALEVLDPLAVHPHLDRLGRKRYAWDGRDDWTTQDIAHLRLLKLPRPDLEGLGPVQAAQRGLRGQLDQAAYASGWFDLAGVPSGVLKSDQHLTADEAQAYKDQWHATQTAHDTAVLGKGLDYQPLHLKPAEVQWLETQQFGVTGIARLFGMTSRQLLAPVDGTSDTYSNQQQDDVTWVKYTLMRYLREYETAVQGLLPRTRTVRFNVDALLRTDTLSRYRAHEVGIRARFLHPDEVRAMEGRAPLTAAQAADLAPAAPAPDLEDQETPA